VGAIVGLFGIDRYIEIGAFAAGTIALALIQGVYASEVFRGAILAVPRGAIEAAQTLGLRRLQIVRTIVVPLAMRYAFGGMVNLWMVVIKNTPFVSAIGLEDFIRAAGTAGQNTKKFFVFYFAVLLTYLLLSAVTMMLQSRISRRLFRHVAGGARC
jgi:polar amino acid transport system permease protein